MTVAHVKDANDCGLCMAINGNNQESDQSRLQDGSGDDISIKDVARMILRHSRGIVAFVLLAMVATMAFVFLLPSKYTAESMLQVILPADKSGKIDQFMFEMKMNSHLKEMNSDFIAGAVAAEVSTGAFKVASSDLSKQVSITRPPKSNMIVLTAEFHLKDQSLSVLSAWVRQYFTSLYKNNIIESLHLTRLKLQKIQGEIAELNARAAQLKKHAERSGQVVDLERGIDETQLWRELSENAPAEKLGTLANIKVKGQEQSAEYLGLKSMLYNADQNYISADARRRFYKEAIQYLEYKLVKLEPGWSGQTPSVSSNVSQYVETMVNDFDVIEFGYPALKTSSNGRLRKIVIVFFASLAAASLCAYLREWYKTISV